MGRLHRSGENGSCDNWFLLEPLLKQQDCLSQWAPFHIVPLEWFTVEPMQHEGLPVICSVSTVKALFFLKGHVIYHGAHVHLTSLGDNRHCLAFC